MFLDLSFWPYVPRLIEFFSFFLSVCGPRECPQKAIECIFPRFAYHSSRYLLGAKRYEKNARKYILSFSGALVRAKVIKEKSEKIILRVLGHRLRAEIENEKDEN